MNSRKIKVFVKYMNRKYLLLLNIKGIRCPNDYNREIKIILTVLKMTGTKTEQEVKGRKKKIKV